MRLPNIMQQMLLTMQAQAIHAEERYIAFLEKGLSSELTRDEKNQYGAISQSDGRSYRSQRLSFLLTKALGGNNQSISNGGFYDKINQSVKQWQEQSNHWGYEVALYNYLLYDIFADDTPSRTGNIRTILHNDSNLQQLAEDEVASYLSSQKGKGFQIDRKRYNGKLLTEDSIRKIVGRFKEKRFGEEVQKFLTTEVDGTAKISSFQMIERDRQAYDFMLYLSTQDTDKVYRKKKDDWAIPLDYKAGLDKFDIGTGTVYTPYNAVSMFTDYGLSLEQRMIYAQTYIALRMIEKKYKLFTPVFITSKLGRNKIEILTCSDMLFNIAESYRNASGIVPSTDVLEINGIENSIFNHISLDKIIAIIKEDSKLVDRMMKDYQLSAADEVRTIDDTRQLAIVDRVLARKRVNLQLNYAKPQIGGK